MVTFWSMLKNVWWWYYEISKGMRQSTVCLELSFMCFPVKIQHWANAQILCLFKGDGILAKFMWKAGHEPCENYK